MSDSDSFIKEVSEELRRDRMNRLWRRFGPWGIGVAVAAVIAAGAVTWMDQRRQAAAEAAGGALMQAALAGSAQAQASAFAQAARELSAGPALIARLSQAAALAEAGDAAAAAEVLDGVAQAGDVDPLYRDLAAFKALTLRAATLTPAERARAFTPFAAESAPFRLLALEARAAAMIEAGDLSAARADIAAARTDPMLTPNLRQRLGGLAVLAGEAS